jgi:hypothetical protein
MASFLALRSATPAHAQNSMLWPTWSFDVGAYDLTTDQKMRIDGHTNRTGTDIDWSKELVPDSQTIFTLDGQWSFADRHTVGLRYQENKEEGTRSLSRQITIGDTVYPIGARVDASSKVTEIDANYTYWWVKHEAYGFGPSFGLIWLQLDVHASATVQAGNAGQTVSRSASANTDVPVPMLGVEVKGTPVRRLILFADGRWLPSVTIGDYTGEASTYSLGARYFIWGPLALGLSYDATAYRVDLDKSSWKGTMRLNEDGWRLFLHAAF